MAIIGHFFPAFWLSIFLSRTEEIDCVPAWMLLKLTMLSDTISGVLFLFGIENLEIYARWMTDAVGHPPIETSEAISRWKDEGRWSVSGDPEQGRNGFEGFVGVAPVYCDLSYSHSVLFVGLFFAIPIAAATKAWYARRSAPGPAFGWRGFLAIVLAVVSHPLLDMVFHDAHIAFGNRSVSRYSLNLWKRGGAFGPIAIVLELFLAYLPFRAWMDRREPRKMSVAAGDQAPAPDDVESLSKRQEAPSTEDASLAVNKEIRRFWRLCWLWNMTTWYSLPLIEYLCWHYIYNHSNQDDDFNEDYALLRIGTDTTNWKMFWVPLSWTIVVWPAHNIEHLTQWKKHRNHHQEGEAERMVPNYNNYV